MIFVRTEFAEYFSVYSSSVLLFYRQTNDCNFVDMFCIVVDQLRNLLKVYHQLVLVAPKHLSDTALKHMQHWAMGIFGVAN